MAKRTIRHVGLAGLLLLSAGAAHAQPCSDAEKRLLPGSSYGGTLRALEAMGCLGTEKDTSILVSRFQELTLDVETSLPRLENLIEATRHLREFAEDKAARGVATTEWSELALLLDNEELAMLAASNETAGDTSLRPSAGILAVDTWDLKNSDTPSNALPGFRLYEGLDEKCPSPGDPNAVSCGAYTERKDMIRTLVLADRLVTYSYRGELVAHAKDARLAVKRWDSYFNDARFQWWWEVWANGRRMERSDLCRDDETGRRIGFCEVPTDQLIILHPEIALQWIDGAQSSDQLSASVLVELFGRNSWSWDDSGAVGSAFGWSIIASYTNLTGLDDWGFGGMVHLNNKYSFGLTSTDGELGVFLSMNLSEWLFNRKQRYLSYLQEVEKRGLREMLFAPN